MRERHCRSGTAAGNCTQRSHITEHFGKRSLCLDNACARTACFHAFNLAAAFVQVRDDIAHRLFGCDNLDLHDRFEEHGTGLLGSFLECLDSAKLERQLVGVDRVERTVENSNLEVLYREAGENAVLHSRLEALLD